MNDDLTKFEFTKEQIAKFEKRNREWLASLSDADLLTQIETHIECARKFITPVGRSQSHMRCIIMFSDELKRRHGG